MSNLVMQRVWKYSQFWMLRSKANIFQCLPRSCVHFHQVLRDSLHLKWHTSENKHQVNITKTFARMWIWGTCLSVQECDSTQNYRHRCMGGMYTIFESWLTARLVVRNGHKTTIFAMTRLDYVFNIYTPFYVWHLTQLGGPLCSR